MKFEIIAFVSLCVACTMAQTVTLPSTDQNADNDQKEVIDADDKIVVEQDTTTISQTENQNYIDDEQTENPTNDKEEVNSEETPKPDTEEASDGGELSTEEPSDDGELSTDEPSSNESTTDESSSNESTTDEPSSNESTSDEPSNNESTDEPSSTEQTTPIQPTTKQPTPEKPEFICTQVGRFPVPQNCNEYYFCWDSVGPHATFTCPEAFNPVRKACSNDYSTCSLSPPELESDGVYPYPDDKKSFWQAKSHKDKGVTTWELHRENCAIGREFSSDYGFCVEAEAQSAESIDSEQQFVCRRAGKFIDYTSDTKYYECTVKSVSHGVLKLKERKCKKGEIFNGDEKHCVPV